MREPGFNSKAYVLTFKDFLAVTRNNISKEKLDRYGASYYNRVGEAHSTAYTSDLAVRYIAQTEVTNDIVMSVYEVSTLSLFVARFSAWSKDVEQQFSSFMGKFNDPKNRHFEARIAGMQNGQAYEGLSDIVRFVKANKLPLMEIDLFGSNIRHVAFDAKTGMSYNILLENRLYKPGELANKAMVQQQAVQPQAARQDAMQATAQH
jgi:hypothetical protein